jgi:anti-anti-sigma factor
VSTVVLIFVGEYDLACKGQLRAELERLADITNVVLDFSGVTYMDSTTLTELIRLHRLRAENLHERETIVLKHKHIKKLFDMLELKKVFRLVDNLDEAVGDPASNADVRYAFTGRVSPEPPSD